MFFPAQATSDPRWCRRGSSENQLQTELKLSHIDSPTGVGDRAEAAGARDRDPRRIQRIAGQRSVRVAKVGMVQDIESLKPQLQILLLSKTEILERREIDIEDSRPGDNVAAKVAIAANGLHGEGLQIEPLASRGVTQGWADAGRVRPVIAVAGIGLILAGDNSQRKAGGHRPNRPDLPTADQDAGQAMIGEPVAFAGRQRIEHRSNETAPRVKNRQAPLATHADSILRLEQVSSKGAEPAAIID